MNIWTEKSIHTANQTDYLDRLYRVYPMANNMNRDVSDAVKLELKECFAEKDNLCLIKTLLEQNVFPIKDSYVAYLKRDKTAIKRNPKTVDRIAGIIYELGYEDTVKSIARPVETNRQIGPLFKNWLVNKSLGIDTTNSAKEFLKSEDDLVLIAATLF